MYEFIWKVFRETGNVEIYLLLKELEREVHIKKIKNTNNVNNSVFKIKAED